METLLAASINAAGRGGVIQKSSTLHGGHDRYAQTLDFVTGTIPVTKAQLRKYLQPVLYDNALLVSDANAASHYFAAERWHHA